MREVDWQSLTRHPQVETLIELALGEDLGAGDLTTRAIFRSPRRIEARLVARAPTVMCAGPLALAIVRRLDPEAELRAPLEEGTAVQQGATLFTLVADVRAVLSTERVVLNFLMRTCGIAAATRAAVLQVPDGCRAKIYDTRKTMPGFRLLDKAAVRTGGGENHRMGLFDAVMIKDNHLAAAGSLTQAVALARKLVQHRVMVEVEIDHLTQLDEALAAGVDVILLDNFDDDALAEAVRRVAGRVELEASGGITHERIASVARTGVDRISLGALTHSAKPADLGMDF